MKFDIQKAFPYPVLRPFSDDYTYAEFQTTVDITVSESEIHMAVFYTVSSDDILKQIQSNKAEYVAVISCRDTYTRHVLYSKETENYISFRITDLRGEVQVQAYIFVKESIPAYRSKEINSEFGSGSFKFSKGDILAQDEPQVFYIERDFFKPVTSVFELVVDNKLRGGKWAISFEQDHIQIKVSAYMKDAIDNARNSRKNKVILLNSIYFAAVMQIVVMLKESPDEFDSYKWSRVIKGKAHNKGIDIASMEAYEATQLLMEYPLTLLDAYVFGVSAL